MTTAENIFGEKSNILQLQISEVGRLKEGLKCRSKPRRNGAPRQASLTGKRSASMDNQKELRDSEMFSMQSFDNGGQFSIIEEMYDVAKGFCVQDSVPQGDLKEKTFDVAANPTQS